MEDGEKSSSQAIVDGYDFDTVDYVQIATVYDCNFVMYPLQTKSVDWTTRVTTVIIISMVRDPWKYQVVHFYAAGVLTTKKLRNILIRIFAEFRCYRKRMLSHKTYQQFK